MKPLNIISKLNESESLIKLAKSKKALKEENRYGNTEDNDPVLDKTIKVYDINKWIDDNINNESEEQYQSFDYNNGAAIIVAKDGSGCILNYEAVGTSFNATSDTVTIYICPKEHKDENGHMVFSIMATASFKVTVDELMTAPSKDMKVRDFFTKYKYNDRCARNFDEIKHYIEDLKESAKLEESTNGYKYIDDSEMNDCVYNSMSNTDVIEILTELQRYFDESVVSIEDVNKNATNDTGMSQADIDACKLGSKNIQEIISALEKAWE